MIIVEPSVVIDGPVDGAKMLRDLEWIARHCYKSEGLICEGSAEKMAKKLFESDPPHVAMGDHITLRCVFICDRGVSHEMVRHKIGVAFAQESTRYCNYSKDKFERQITVIRPPNLKRPERWEKAMRDAEEAYMEMLDAGDPPEIARSVLPNATKTEVVCTHNITAWRHIFNQRAVSKRAHPQMRQVMAPLLSWCRETIPVLFNDRVPAPLPEGVKPAIVTVECRE
jgi:thymidylate synthase (FAD)